MRPGSSRSPDTLASIENAPRTDPAAGRLSWALSSTTRATPNGTEREQSPSARKALSMSAASAPLCLQSVDLSAGFPTTWSTENRGPRATGSPALERVCSSSSAMGTAMGFPEALSRESATTTVPGLRSGARAPANPPAEPLRWEPARVSPYNGEPHPAQLPSGYVPVSAPLGPEETQENFREPSNRERAPDPLQEAWHEGRDANEREYPSAPWERRRFR